MSTRIDDAPDAIAAPLNQAIEARPGAGPIMAIGGAEDKLDDKIILSTFVQLAGGRTARIAIVPTASSIEAAGERYKALFLGMGADQAEVVVLSDRRDANGEAPIEIVEDATGVFMTGGNQMRLATIVGGTRVADLVRHRNNEGAVVAGTSAGRVGLVVAHGRVRRQRTDTPATDGDDGRGLWISPERHY